MIITIILLYSCVHIHINIDTSIVAAINLVVPDWEYIMAAKGNFRTGG